MEFSALLLALDLAVMDNDGRYLFIGSVRNLTGPVKVEDLLRAGADCVQMLDGVILI